MDIGLSVGVGSSAGATSGGSFFTPTYQIMGGDNSLPVTDSGNATQSATPTTTVTPTTAMGGTGTVSAAAAGGTPSTNWTPWIIAGAIVAAVLIFKR